MGTGDGEKAAKRPRVVAGADADGATQEQEPSRKQQGRGGAGKTRSADSSVEAEQPRRELQQHDQAEDDSAHQRVLPEAVAKDILAAVRAGELDELIQATAKHGVPVTSRLLAPQPAHGYQGPSTVLLEAAWYGHIDIALHVLDTAGVHVDEANEYEITPLMFAVCRGHLALSKLLVSRGAEVDRKNSRGDTPLIKAARNSRTEVVAWLCSKRVDGDAESGGGATVDLMNNQGFTATMVACLKGCLPCVKALVEIGGADLDLRRVVSSPSPTASAAGSPSKGDTLLMLAVSEGHECVTEYLVGTDPATGKPRVHLNAKDHDGRTALIIAAGQGSGGQKVIALLVAAGVDINTEDNDGFTALLHAARWRKLSLVKFFVALGATIPTEETLNAAGVSGASDVGDYLAPLRHSHVIVSSCSKAQLVALSLAVRASYNRRSTKNKAGNGTGPGALSELPAAAEAAAAAAAAANGSHSHSHSHSNNHALSLRTLKRHVLPRCVYYAGDPMVTHLSAKDRVFLVQHRHDWNK